MSQKSLLIPENLSYEVIDLTVSFSPDSTILKFAISILLQAQCICSVYKIMYMLLLRNTHITQYYTTMLLNGQISLDRGVD